MADAASFTKVVGDWIDGNTWPRKSSSDTDVTKPKSILVVDSRRSETKFRFQSAFSYIQISAKYDDRKKTLSDVQIKLVAPCKPDATVVASKGYYPVSKIEGEKVHFDLGQIKGAPLNGWIFFKIGEKNDIFATYDVKLPYAGDLADTIDISPTKVSKDSGFTTAQLEAIPLAAETEEEEATQSGDSEFTTNGNPATPDQQLFVAFLKDFVVGKNNVVIPTYYGGTTDTLEGRGPSTQAGSFSAHASPAAAAVSSASNEWRGTVSFLGVLELVGSVDPKTFTLAAALYVRVPIVGRVRLAQIKGSLIDGISLGINVHVAKGKVTFSLKKNNRKQHVIYVEAELTLKFVGTVKTNGAEAIVTLPF